MFTNFGKIVIAMGFLLIIVGVIILFKDKIPLIKLLSDLPGSITIKKQNFTFYFPITACIFVSVVVSLIAWITRKL